MKPKILLLSPGILKWTDMDFGLPHLVALGGYVRAHTGVEVEILDLNYEGGDHHSLARTLDELGPFLLIGVSTYSSFDRMRSLAVARFLRDRYPDTPIVTGGYHASAVPDDLLFDGSPFDVVMKGEAEELLASAVRTVLGGEKLEPGVHGPGKVRDLDALPPMQWDLLDRYWPRALQLGRKLQVYLARGCPYRCTFCMERSKSGYQWRAYSPERAVEELERLGTYTDLSQWVVNIADPLFGFQRRWRREVLEGIVRKGILPRQYWTLTRSDDLGDEDIELLAQARFSIGIGLESGSPDMLRIMQKGNKPEKYLAAVEHLAERSQAHGLNWAVNVIVGHPGETPQTAQETLDFVTQLFRRSPTTRGFLSIDPFRLYPGSYVHETMDAWEDRYGARFHHRDWWRAWYDHGYLAQHLEPSSSLSFDERVRFMHRSYRPLLEEIRGRFTGQDRDVDRVYERSMQGQIDALSPAVERQTLQRARRAMQTTKRAPDVRFPLGMNQKDPAVRLRETIIRRLLDRGVLRSADLVSALLAVDPLPFLGQEDTDTLLRDQAVTREAEGAPVPAIGLTTLATALEALEPEGRVCDVTAANGYVGALLSELVGPSGEVVVRVAPERLATVQDTLADRPNVRVIAFDPRDPLATREVFDRLLLQGAVPRTPPVVHSSLNPGGRAVAFVGPRFRNQALTVFDREGDTLKQHRVRKVTVPALAGPGGWLRAPKPRDAAPSTVPVRFSRRPAPTFCYHLLAHLDLGADAATVYDPALPAPAWVAPLLSAYRAAPGRLALQAHSLPFVGVDSWLRALRERPPTTLQDAAGQRLIECVLAAADAEREAFDAWWTEHRPAAGQLAADAGAQLAQPIARLRERLWEAQTDDPPPLLVLDIPALGRRGRATTRDGTRLVAVDLAQPAAHILMQVLHEEVHPLTDPLVLVELPEGVRDTHAESAGFAIHQALEQTAVLATEAFLTQKAKELLPDFRRWLSEQGGSKPANAS